MKRNLSYYVHPIKNSTWRWNLDQILSRWDVFTGQKVVSVSCDEATEPFGAVLDVLSKFDCDVILSRNRADLRESKTFVPALGLLRFSDPESITFYAHAKGVTRKGGEADCVSSWADGMYRVCLSRPDLIDRVMAKYDAAGCFLHEIPGHAGSDWHFSGTFFWLRNSAAFAGRWWEIYPSWFGTEGYPGRIVPRTRARPLTPTGDNYYAERLPPSDVQKWISDLEAARDL